MMTSDYKDNDIEFAGRILSHREELTNEEVERWLVDVEHRHLLDRMAGLKREVQNRNFNALKAAEWQRLQRRMGVRRLFPRTRGIAAAAVVALALGCSLWFWGQRFSEVSPSDSLQLAQIKPGSNCAELVLANGESVHLDASCTIVESDVLKGILNDSVKGLDYSQVAVLDEKMKSGYNSLRVPVGGFYKLELPDGTKVWLNAASELKFPVEFSGDKREVSLKGEGYFQVKRDTSRQFIVNLKNSQVMVLGTSFNINAYDDEECVYTTLTEGSVAFYSEQKQQKVVLKPGMQSAMMVRTGETTIAEVNPADVTSWVNGYFVFKAMNLEMIMRQLQRWYDFEVFYQNPEVKRYEFRGRFERDMAIRNVLDVIEEATDLKCEIQGKSIVIKK